MIVDTSAMVAIALKEPGWEEIHGALLGAQVAGMGAPTVAELGLVLTVRLSAPSASAGVVGRLLQELGVAVVPFGEAHWVAAVQAWQRFGKGRHPAALNFGDCLSYATAKLARMPLLCKGDDFPQTDLTLTRY